MWTYFIILTKNMPSLWMSQNNPFHTNIRQHGWTNFTCKQMETVNPANQNLSTPFSHIRGPDCLQVIHGLSIRGFWVDSPSMLYQIFCSCVKTLTSTKDTTLGWKKKNQTSFSLWFRDHMSLYVPFPDYFSLLTQHYCKKKNCPVNALISEMTLHLSHMGEDQTGQHTPHPLVLDHQQLPDMKTNTWVAVVLHIQHILFCESF